MQLTGRENVSGFSDSTAPLFVFLCFPTVSPFAVFGRHSSCVACSGLSSCFIALLLVTVLMFPRMFVRTSTSNGSFCVQMLRNLVKTGDEFARAVCDKSLNRSAVLHVQTSMNHMSR